MKEDCATCKFKYRGDISRVEKCIPCRDFSNWEPEMAHPEDTPTSPEQLADAHWEYVENVICNTQFGFNTNGVLDVDAFLIQIGFHYKSAFIHGFKHGVESTKE